MKKKKRKWIGLGHSNWERRKHRPSSSRVQSLLNPLPFALQFGPAAARQPNPPSLSFIYLSHMPGTWQLPISPPGCSSSSICPHPTQPKTEKKTEYYVSPPSTLHLLHSLSRYLPSFSSFEIFNDHHHQGHRYNVLTDINLIINGGKRRSHGWCFWGLQRSRRTGHRGHNFLFLFALIPTPPDFRFDF